MSEHADTSTASFSEALGPQHQYGESGMPLAQQIMVQAGEAAGHAHPDAWAETVRRWWKTVAPVYGQTDPTLFDKFIPQAIAYLLFSEQALKIIQALQDDADWRQALQRGFADIRDTFFQPFQAGDAAHPGLAAFWGLPLDAWQRIASSVSAPPHDIQQARREDHGDQTDGSTGEELEKTSENPTGYTREWQEHAQQGRRLWSDYQQAHQAYTELLRKAAMRSLELLQDRLIEMAETDLPVKSLRQFYNLWVDCSEAAYAETVRGEEYSRINARMINSLMRYKRHGQGLMDKPLSALNGLNRQDERRSEPLAQTARPRTPSKPQWNKS